MYSPDHSFDGEQDAQLRAVPLPEGLLAKLRKVALADDEGLDAALRCVAVPQGLCLRLRQAIIIDDDVLDEAVREVPIPVGLAKRLHREAWPRLPVARLTQWATAASLALAIGLSYVGAMVALLLTAYPGESPRLELVASQISAELLERPDRAIEIAGVERSSGDGLRGSLPAAWPPAAAPVELADLGGYAPSPLEEVARLFDHSASNPQEETNWGLLGSPVFDELPELKRVPGPKPQGIALPLVPGANIDFLIEHGVRPFVFPAAHVELLTSEVPLDVDTSSYALTLRCLEDGRLPAAGDIRTEEFLQAVVDGFAAPKQRPLGLSVACGPSPFGTTVSGKKHMLLIGVKARNARREDRRPLRLVLAVDVSASMRGGGRMKSVRRALRELAERLGPKDRISLVPFSETAHLLLDDAGRDDADQLLVGIDLLTVEKSTNLGAGLRTACAAARRLHARDGLSTSVVLLTDGLTKLSRGTTELIEERLAKVAEEGISLQVIELGQDKRIDPQLVGFASAGNGKIRRARSADQIYWSLLEIITGHSHVVSEDVQLSVTFNPDAVLSYRLLGHEADVTAALQAESPKTDFHAGQTATALYEIELKPEGNKEVASVELTWREPEGDWEQVVYSKVHRKQFGSSLVEAPASLQAAIVVAQAAEVLRKSPFARVSEKSRSLGWVLALAGQLDTRLYEQPSFVEFVSLLKRAEDAR